MESWLISSSSLGLSIGVPLQLMELLPNLKATKPRCVSGPSKVADLRALWPCPNQCKYRCFWYWAEILVVECYSYRMTMIILWCCWEHTWMMTFRIFKPGPTACNFLLHSLVSSSATRLIKRRTVNWRPSIEPAGNLFMWHSRGNSYELREMLRCRIAGHKAIQHDHSDHFSSIHITLSGWW